MPLSSKYILVMLDRNYFKEYQQYDCQAHEMDEKYIKFYNDSQVVGNNLQVFSEFDNLDKIEKIYISGSDLAMSKKSLILK